MFIRRNVTRPNFILFKIQYIYNWVSWRYRLSFHSVYWCLSFLLDCWDCGFHGMHSDHMHTSLPTRPRSTLFSPLTRSVSLYVLTKDSLYCSNILNMWPPTEPGLLTRGYTLRENQSSLLAANNCSTAKGGISCLDLLLQGYTNFWLSLPPEFSDHKFATTPVFDYHCKL